MWREISLADKVRQKNQNFLKRLTINAVLRSSLLTGARTMGLIITGIVINLFGCLGILNNSLESESASFAYGFFYALLAFWLISVVGAVFALMGKRKLGGILVIIGSIAFMPIGLIGIFGAKRLMKPSLVKDLDDRRDSIRKGVDSSSS
jgi:hypothetical protein